ncbi:MAG: class I SAM-dependent methyltransferase [Bryobacterales bacterium]|nr:class I SAM-dependent methyltransferase [Bryobacterales bacterium]MBV9400882.1 class I SAM-dependent methyltransferase [Bryobacterales bacterium]
MSSTSSPTPNPLGIIEALDAYQISLALRGAVELDVFTHIADGATTPAEIAKRAKASERGTRILCDFLTVRGFLTKTGNAYGLTPESSAFLNKRSPTYIGSIALFLAHSYHVTHFLDIAAVVRNDGSLNQGNMGPNDPIWVEFARHMMPIAISAREMVPMVAQPGRPMKVLDISAGPGLYGIFVAQHNPAAQIYAVDWPNVLEVSKENAAKLGVADRFHTIPGSAFEVDFGGGYDLVLLPNFLHHFDPPTNVQLLKKIRAAMNPDALLATLEAIPNDDRVSPPFLAAFSMMMLATTPGGDAYTFSELDGMFRQAGFGKSELIPLKGSIMPLVLTRQ